MVISWWLQQKISGYIQKIFLLLWKFLSYLVCAPSFKSINSSSLSRKKYNGNSFTPSPCKLLRGQNTSAGIGLIELTLLSDTLNYKPFVKHCILQTMLKVFLLSIFVWNKICCSKDWVVFNKFLNWFWLSFGVTVLKVLCFWCPFIRL